MRSAKLFWIEKNQQNFLLFSALILYALTAPVFSYANTDEAEGVSPAECPEQVATGGDPRKGLFRSLVRELFARGTTDGKPWRAVYGVQNFRDRFARIDAEHEKDVTIFLKESDGIREAGVARRAAAKARNTEAREAQIKRLAVTIEEKLKTRDLSRVEYVAGWRNDRKLGWEEWRKMRGEQIRAMCRADGTIWKSGFWGAFDASETENALTKVAGEGARDVGLTIQDPGYFQSISNHLQFLTRHYDEIPEVLEAEQAYFDQSTRNGKRVLQLDDKSYREFRGKLSKRGYELMGILNRIAKKYLLANAKAAVANTGFVAAYPLTFAGKSAVVLWQAGFTGVHWGLLLTEDLVIFVSRAGGTAAAGAVVTVAIPVYALALDGLGVSGNALSRVGSNGTDAFRWTADRMLRKASYAIASVGDGLWNVASIGSRTGSAALTAGRLFGRMLKLSIGGGLHNAWKAAEGTISYGTSIPAVMVLGGIGASTVTKDAIVFLPKLAWNVAFPKLRRTIDLNFEVDSTDQDFEFVGLAAEQIRASLEEKFQCRVTGKGGVEGSKIELFDDDTSQYVGKIDVLVRHGRLVADVTMSQRYVTRLVGSSERENYIKELSGNLPGYSTP